MELNKKITLKNKLFKSFITTALIPIFVIECMLLFMYFYVNNSNLEETTNLLEKKYITELNNSMNFNAKLLNNNLKNIYNLSLSLQREHESFFRQKNICETPNGVPQFKRHKNGAYFKSEDNSGSSAYLSKNTKLTDDVIQKLKCSESMDLFFKQIIINYPFVSQIYFNTYDNMNRIYPFIKDIPSIYGSDVFMKKFNFYYEADLKHNPTKKPVWTKAYIDPAGKGWVISNIVPIYSKKNYQDNFLEGVTGMDITVDFLVKELLKQKIAGDNKVLIVDKDGDILAMSPEIENLFGLKELTDHSYEQNIQKTVFKPKIYNLYSLKHILNTKEVKKYLPKDKVTVNTFIKGKEYILSQNIIPQTKWRLIMFLDKESVNKPLQILHLKHKNFGTLAIYMMIVFYIVFFIYILRKAYVLSKEISKPLEELKILSQKLQYSKDIKTLESNNIIEIDVLNKNFNTLKLELKNRTERLVQSQLSKKMFEKEKTIMERLSKTDHLTNISNRRYAEEFFENELKRVKRFNQKLGIILIDIDFFKKINDDYGHLIGDECLIKTANFLKNNIRDVDFIARWGGEEFLIICVNSSNSRIMNVAEKLRKNISELTFSNGNNITISLGCTIYEEGDNMDKMIYKADKALYEAKDKGRNQSQFYEENNH